MQFVADQCCFACGRENPIGLRLSFRWEDAAYVTTFVADPAFQGYHGIIHGGILATVLDEVMVRHVWERLGPCATAKLEIRYRHPAPVGHPIDVRAWVTTERRARRIHEMAACARMVDGTVLAEATSLVIATSLPAGE